MKLSGKKTGDILIEVIGPIQNKNYNTRDHSGITAPKVHVKVTGTGAVKVQETTVRDFGNEISNTVNPGLKASSDPADWTDISGPITNGFVTLILVPDDTFKALRLVVDTPGDADVVFVPDWWK